MKKLFVSDLNGTLAAIKSSLGSDMAELLHDLMGEVKVAVISGGTWSQFQEQLLANLPIDVRLADFSLLPTCGTQFHQYVGHWPKVYSEDLSKKERQQQLDPDFAKRKKIVAILKPLIHEFAINMGGTTSIGKLRDHLNISIPDMLFADDAIFPGGNNYPAQDAGVDSILVRDPRETARVIQTVLACLGDASTQIKSPGQES
ncbi:MAG TPA: hypothetical protein VMV52_10085 [Candidatus Nanopelagicaceae bacterium]|nr:hypothetical protein [Candidatus Nanopelagicaceae bacterium]